MPAFTNTPSSPPSSPAARSSAASTAAASVTSQALAPARVSRPATPATVASLEPRTPTRSPAAPSRSAQARPIPLVPPEMTMRRGRWSVLTEDHCSSLVLPVVLRFWLAPPGQHDDVIRVLAQLGQRAHAAQLHGAVELAGQQLEGPAHAQLAARGKPVQVRPGDHAQVGAEGQGDQRVGPVPDARVGHDRDVRT